jgi:hypothetical protein
MKNEHKPLRFPPTRLSPFSEFKLLIRVSVDTPATATSTVYMTPASPIPEHFEYAENDWPPPVVKLSQGRDTNWPATRMEDQDATPRYEASRTGKNPADGGVASWFIAFLGAGVVLGLAIWLLMKIGALAALQR